MPLAVISHVPVHNTKGAPISHSSRQQRFILPHRRQHTRAPAAESPASDEASRSRSHPEEKDPRRGNTAAAHLFAHAHAAEGGGAGRISPCAVAAAAISDVTLADVVAARQTPSTRVTRPLAMSDLRLVNQEQL